MISAGPFVMVKKKDLLPGRSADEGGLIHERVDPYCFAADHSGLKTVNVMEREEKEPMLD